MLGQLFKKIFYPKPIPRLEEELKLLEVELTNHQLNVRFGCPFCIKVQKEVHRLNLPLKIVDTDRDPKQKAEQIKGGGKAQVPCLKIEKSGGVTKWMFESADINRYLAQKFAISSIE